MQKVFTCFGWSLGYSWSITTQRIVRWCWRLDFVTFVLIWKVMGWLNWNKCLMHGKSRQKCKSSKNLTNSQASCSWVCGLPLLINRVASTFRRKDNIHIWSDGLRSLQRCPNVKVQGMDELIEFLKFCYEDLDCDDKKIKK